MKSPKLATLEQLMAHENKRVRTLAHDLFREVTLYQAQQADCHQKVMLKLHTPEEKAR